MARLWGVESSSAFAQGRDRLSNSNTLISPEGRMPPQRGPRGVSTLTLWRISPLREPFPLRFNPFFLPLR